MARAFNPLDTTRIARWQARGIALDRASAALGAPAPVRLALASWFGWPGAAGVTLVADRGAPPLADGFVQLRRPRGGPEAVLTYAAPDLHGGHGAALGWLRLLGDASVALGRAGVDRILCAHDHDDGLVWQVLHQAGFAPYGRDVVMRAPAADAPPAAPAGAEHALQTVTLRPEHRDRVAALVAEAQPEGERAFGAAWPRWLTAPAAAPGCQRLRVLLDDRGRAVGGLRFVVGRGALWLGLVRAPEADADAVVAAALAEASRLRPGWTVWTAVPMAEPALAAAWRAAGGEAEVERRLAARPTGRQRVAPRWRAARRSAPHATSNPITQARPGASRARVGVDALSGERT